MKKYYLFLTLLTLALAGYARQLSPQEALNRVKNGPAMAKSISNVSQPLLVHEVKSSIDGREASVYVFSETSRDKGFVVLSADDEITPVLGYSSTSSFESSQMPENMKWWLEEMGRQVDYAVSTGATQYAPASIGPAIEPIVKAEWGQGEPYNKYTPVISGSNTPTGCVATALCQIMYHHKWPEAPIGSNTYTKNDVEYSIDYSGMTFDWSLMTDTYNDNSTEASKEAVSTLMKAVGYGVDMSYGIGGSGATNNSVKNAMNKFFGYKDNYGVVQRSLFTAEEWEKMFYHMLSNDMPIFQTGRDGIWLMGTVGHAFICDGYDGNGYFHYNWGWDGKYNGYFLLSCLTPSGVGTGGSAGGYNYKQEIFVNLQPDNGKTYDVYKYLLGGLMDFKPANNTMKIKIDTNYGISSAEIGFVLTNDNFNKTISLGNVALGSRVTINLPSEWDDNLDKSLKYDFRLVWRENRNDSWRKLLPNLYDTTFEISHRPDYTGGVLSYENDKWTVTTEIVDIPEMPLQVDSLEFTLGDIIVIGLSNKYTVAVTNPTENHFLHGVHHFLLPVDGGDRALLCNTNIELGPSESKVGQYLLDVDASKISEGKYYLALIDAIYDNEIYCDRSRVYTVTNADNLIFDDGAFTYLITGSNTVSLTGTLGGQPLTGDVTIPATVTNEGVTYLVANIDIAWNKLINAKEITSLNIQYPVDVIPRIGNFSVLTTLTLGEGIKEIPSSFCSGVSTLVTVNLPSTIEKIGNSAFYNCKSMKINALPKSLKTIEDNAFYSCSSIDIPLILSDNVESVGNYAFSGCSLVPSVIIGNGITEITQNSFANLKTMKSLSIGKNVTTIGNRAFYNCPALLDIDLSVANIETINDYAFHSCKLAKSIKLPNSLKTIGNYAFNYCQEAENISLGQSLVSIGNSAFNNCLKVKSIELPKNVISVGKSAFSQCSEASTISLNEGLETISDYAFSSCSSVTNLVIPTSVKLIGESAFSISNSLKSLWIKAAEVDSIKSNIFNCSKLEWLMICEGVKVIDTRAFYGCTNISYIDLPASLEAIGSRAFYRSSLGGASDITVISRAEVPPTIEKDAFASKIYNIATLKVLPQSLESYKDDTDGWAQFVNIEGDKTTGIDSVENDDNSISAFPVEVYTVNGQRVATKADAQDISNLAPGLYIVTDGKNTIKLSVK